MQVGSYHSHTGVRLVSERGIFTTMGYGSGSNSSISSPTDYWKFSSTGDNVVTGGGTNLDHVVQSGIFASLNQTTSYALIGSSL